MERALPSGRRPALLLAFQPRDAVFVSLSDLEKGRAGIPQCSDLPCVFGNLPRLFGDLSRLFLAFTQKKFDRLCQGLVAFG